MNKKDHVLNALLLGVGLGFVLHPAGTVETLRTVAAVVVPVTLGALLPDVDTEFGRHRKSLHNLFVLGGLYAYPFVFGNLAWVWAGVATHYALDVLGSKRGIALFYPLSEAEYGLPVGVATDSRAATVATVLITAVEVAAIAGVLHYAPQVLPGGLDAVLASL